MSVRTQFTGFVQTKLNMGESESIYGQKQGVSRLLYMQTIHNKMVGLVVNGPSVSSLKCDSAVGKTLRVGWSEWQCWQTHTEKQVFHFRETKVIYPESSSVLVYVSGTEVTWWWYKAAPWEQITLFLQKRNEVLVYDFRSWADWWKLFCVWHFWPVHDLRILRVELWDILSHICDKKDAGKVLFQ